MSIASKNFFFDVDGTLTLPRQKMDDEFNAFFTRWYSLQHKRNHKIFFITGSNRDKTIEQLGRQLWISVDGSYQNCANQLYRHGELIKESQWKMPPTLYLDILETIEESLWYGKSTRNIEERVGMVNISTVGRNAPPELRKEYSDWDKRNFEREGISDRFSDKYPDLEFVVGGELSIDIYPKGNNKGQALKDISGETIFFGDKCERGGNDFPIASRATVCHNVSGWQMTWNIMKQYI